MYEKQNSGGEKGNSSITVMNIQVSRAKIVLLQKILIKAALVFIFSYMDSQHGYFTKCHLILFVCVLLLFFNMGVPRLGATTASLYHSHSNAGSLTH